MINILTFVLGEIQKIVPNLSPIENSKAIKIKCKTILTIKGTKNLDHI